MQSTLESAFKEIYEQIKNLKVFESSDESFVGRFAHKYTSIVFTVCFMIHRIHSFGDLNIYCIFSNEISSDDTKEFSRRFCWASNTYYVPSDRTLPHKGETREYRITYYQWVPWILMFCAFFVMTPFKIWHYLTKGSRFDLEKIMIYVLKAKESKTKLFSLKKKTRQLDDKKSCSSPPRGIFFIRKLKPSLTNGKISIRLY